jgi:hypothetical protein
MNIKLFNTAPSKNDPFWQIVLIPTITILRSPEDAAYTVFSMEWLFWSITIIINDFKRQKTEGVC